MDRTVRIKGTTKVCQHDLLEELRNLAEEVIARRCCLCGLIYGKAICSGCKLVKFCAMVSANGDERFCTEDCRKREIARRAKRPSTAADRKRRAKRR